MKPRLFARSPRHCPAACLLLRRARFAWFVCCLLVCRCEFRQHDHGEHTPSFHRRPRRCGDARRVCHSDASAQQRAVRSPCQRRTLQCCSCWQCTHCYSIAVCTLCSLLSRCCLHAAPLVGKAAPSSHENRPSLSHSERVKGAAIGHSHTHQFPLIRRDRLSCCFSGLAPGRLHCYCQHRGGRFRYQCCCCCCCCSCVRDAIAPAAFPS